MSKSEAPVGNTGLKCQNPSHTVSIDWLTVTFNLPSIDELRAVVDFVGSELVDEFCWYPERGIKRGKWWEATARSVHGIQVAYNPGGDRIDALISIPATALRRASSRTVWRMCRGLAWRWKANCSRIDIALDDYEKSISYETVAEAVAKGNYARAMIAHPLPGECRRGQNLPSAQRGWTITFGSRQSDKFVRYYNKSVESKGELDCYRWEVEFKGERASDFWIVFYNLDFDETMAFVLANYVTGAISFVDRSVPGRLSRQPVLSWWAEFTEKAGAGVRTRSRVQRASLERKIRWIHRSVETSLALLQDALGKGQFEAFLRSALTNGRKRYTREHENLLKVALCELAHPVA